MTRAAPVHPLELISAEIDGEITLGETRFLQAHLRACSSCQKKRAELSSIAAGLRDLPVAAPPDGAVDRLLTRLHKQKHPVLLLPPGPVAVPEQVPQVASPRHRARWVFLATGVVTLAVVLLSFRAGVPMDPPVAADPVLASSTPPPAPVEKTTPVAPVPLVAKKEPARRGQPAPALEPAAEPVPEPAPKHIEAPRAARPEEGPAELLPAITFKGNSKRLSREARQHVASVAEFLRQHAEVKLTIRGHADERRSAEKNLALAEKRALAVAEYLESLGIDPSRLQPAPAGNEDNRVEFAVER